MPVRRSTSHVPGLGRHADRATAPHDLSEPMTDPSSTSSSDSGAGRAAGLGVDPSGRPAPSPSAAYAEADLAGVVARFHDPRSRDGGWLAIARTLAEALGRGEAVDPSIRPEAVGRPLPPATVFLLGATEGPTPGCLGHISARPSSWTIGGRGGGRSEATIADGLDVAEGVVAAVLETVRSLAPDAVAPELEVVVPIAGEGDSHALAVGIAAMHALLRGPVPRGTAATGGFDPAVGRFRPVPVETLGAKIAAARRWGVRRLVVVAGQPFPGDAPPADLEVLEVSDDPGVLPLLVLALAGSGSGADVAAGDTSAAQASLDAWRRALALYDLRVARRRSESIESVHRTTAPFLDPVLERLRRASGATMAAETSSFPGLDVDAEAVRDAVRAADVDPVLAGLAADIRSRVHLHVGRTVESAWWDSVSVALRGIGDLPDGLLGDHLLHQQPSHRSVLALDLGDLDDADPAPMEMEPGMRIGLDAGVGVPIGPSHPHAELDRVIDDLEHRWRTRHQSLLAVFASNTRWRRRLYLARRDLDLERFHAATADLLRWRDRWRDLLESHARDGLRMGDTDLARQWNYVVEHAITEVSLLDSDGFARGGASLDIRREVAARWAADAELVADLDTRRAAPEAMSSFDLRGLLQWRWLLGDERLPDSVVTRCRACLADGRGPAGIGADVGVAEWWRRSPTIDGRDLELVHDTLRRSLVPHLRRMTGDPSAPPPGIPRIVALRRAAMLDLDGVPVTEDIDSTGAGWVAAIERPSGPPTLRRLFDDLVSRPAMLLVRTPY